MGGFLWRETEEVWQGAERGDGAEGLGGEKGEETVVRM